MSYHCYSIDGYGVRLSDYTDKIDINKMCELIAQTSDMKNKFNDYIEPMTIYNDKDKIDFDIIDEFGYENCEGCLGVASVLSDIIYEMDDVCFATCKDFYNNSYIIYEPSYPWKMSNAEKCYTEKYIESVLEKYFMKLGVKEVDVDYYSVEKGG